MDPKELVPGFGFSAWSPSSFDVYLPPRLEMGEPCEDSDFPTLSLHQLPLGFHSQPPVFPSSSLGSTSSNSVLQLKEQFHSQSPSLIPFRRQKTSVTPAPIQPTESSHLPPSQNCPGLRDSKSLSLHLHVTGLIHFTR